ncbi:MAG TPA: hypothetical protein VFF67_10280 [Thermoplasmata archaeon]|nr:hypothetical protein [Thermoplasmata archaeon]
MAERSASHVRAARGWGASVAGIVLVVVGVGILIWGILQNGTVAIPVNTVTLSGAGVAAVGGGLAAIGLERGAPHEVG